MARSEEVDRLPQLLTSTAMLLPLSSTKLKAVPLRDYRGIAREAMAQEEVRRIAQQLCATGAVTKSVIQQLKQAKVPPAVVQRFKRLKDLKSRKITLIMTHMKPSPATPADLKSDAFAEAQRRSDWGELVVCLDNADLKNRGEREVCLKRIRELSLEEKLRRVLAEPAP